MIYPDTVNHQSAYEKITGVYKKTVEVYYEKTIRLCLDAIKPRLYS